MYLKCT